MGNSDRRSRFNPRSREGNDLSAGYFQSSGRSFNPRSREGNDYPKYCADYFHFRFQSTFPRGERPIRSKKSSGDLEFQSTFPRGERRRGVSGFILRIHSVSIHVPARGTTSQIHADHANFPRVSIHVPARGTTALLHRLCTASLGFNPRSREGNDLS